MSDGRKRLRLRISGAVQGVGFRPYVYCLAVRLGLSGYVLNDPGGVTAEIEGQTAALDEFLETLRASHPPMARITGVAVSEIAPTGEAGFHVLLSRTGGDRGALILPDVATCGDCIREMNDPADRRYRYAFINCTNCGPRYTIIRALPYDRARTTMAAFAMCPRCRSEYEDPANRRFHAEPTCCPECGPRLRLVTGQGEEIACRDEIEEVVRRLRGGEIAAVKGLGGFHLACDARNAEAVALLRRRKHRDLKPFAVMVRDLGEAAAICRMSASDEALLSGPERPIVLIRKRPGNGLAEGVAPRSPFFGVMLPYTPLHHLLTQSGPAALVMTSGNVSDEPIAHQNEEALERLKELADCFLLHDREIHIRADDSVVQTVAGRPRFLRRSRGYAPLPVRLPLAAPEGGVLAVGPELNNTVCLMIGCDAFVSHHVGDVSSVAAYESFLQAVSHLEGILEARPAAAAHDMHPGYLSTRYARKRGLPTIAVQHHHAHIASVLAEAGRTDKVIGVSFDGLGWGPDGTIWGGEFLVCDLGGFERFGCLYPIAQPGGDAAAKDARRMAFAWLLAAYGEEAAALACRLMPGLERQDAEMLGAMIEKGVNSPLTSSAGRLFDAAAALLGVCNFNTFHAQAPMELEAKAQEAAGEEGFYAVRIAELEGGTRAALTTDIACGLVSDILAGTDAAACAARFHNSMAQLVLDMCLEARKNTGLGVVALSGGVMANAYLVERLVGMLQGAGFEVLLNENVPPGDGGVSLGQAAAAAWRLKRCV